MLLSAVKTAEEKKKFRLKHVSIDSIHSTCPVFLPGSMRVSPVLEKAPSKMLPSGRRDVVEAAREETLSTPSSSFGAEPPGQRERPAVRRVGSTGRRKEIKRGRQDVTAE